MEFLIVLSVVCAALGYLVAAEDKKGTGALLGGLLGPVGVLVAALIK